MALNRTIMSLMKQLADKYPILALCGPRRSGKTTLLRAIFPNYRYLDMEDPDLRSFAENDPKGFLKEYDKHVIFDEVHHAPALFPYLQTLVDGSGIMGRFILSGSQNFEEIPAFSHGLAKQAAFFTLFPFDTTELRSAGWLDPNDHLADLLNGFYPARYDQDIPPKIFYANYVRNFIHHDLSELYPIRDLRLFQKFFNSCATRAGQVLNLNALARECGISQPTAKSWLSVLEKCYIVFQLDPYQKSFGKRIVKTPKLYFYDNGLLCYLLKINTKNQLQTHPLKGILFENRMIAEYIKQMHHHHRQKNLWFWRDSAGHEVNFMIEDEKGIEIVEFKASMTFMPEMFKGLNYFEKLSGITNLNKTLVYTGDKAQLRTAGKVLPWKFFPI